MKASSFFVLLALLGALVLPGRATAQANRPTAAEKAALRREIAAADSAAFVAFNAHDAEALMAFFTKDVEFYNDGSTRTFYEQTRSSFAAMFKNVPDIQRQLVPGSLEVYPVRDYGAIATGRHRFCHQENGRADCGTFKFTTVWQKQAGGAWKMSRVISYDH